MSPRALVDGLLALALDKSLPARERDRRVHVAVQRAQLDAPGVESLLRELGASAAPILNAVRAALPPGVRHLALERAAGVAATLGDAGGAKREAGDGDAPAGDGDNATLAVVLVGTEAEHANNIALLRGGNLRPLRVGSIESLLKVANTGMCGFAIAPSAWPDGDEAAQRDALMQVLGLSTFLYVRLGTDRLMAGVAERLLDIATDARCAVPDAKRFCHAATCELNQADLQTMSESQSLLAAADGAGFVPLGVSDQQYALMRLIAADRKRPADPISVRRLGARELAGGRSGARLYLLQPTSGSPFVVKLDLPTRLASEVQLYKQWIEDWERQVTGATLHRHLGTAGISYRLQGNADAPEERAPTLEEELDRIRGLEWLESSEVETAAPNLAKAIGRAASRLADLNAKASGGPFRANEFWLAWPIAGLAARGVKVEVENDDGGALDVATLCRAAVKILEPLLSTAVTHGDIHGRNILLIDRVPAFIDYADSGPGHPMEDLARLDATVRHAALRAAVDEASLAALLRDIYVEGVDADTAIVRHVAAAASPSCRLAIQSAVMVRSQALRVAERHGAKLRDYLAMVAVVSSYLLATRAPGSSVERACLRAVAPALF